MSPAKNRSVRNREQAKATKDKERYFPTSSIFSFRRFGIVQLADNFLRKQNSFARAADRKKETVESKEKLQAFVQGKEMALNQGNVGKTKKVSSRKQKFSEQDKKGRVYTASQVSDELQNTRGYSLCECHE
jgi:hypothetical protein